MVSSGQVQPLDNLQSKLHIVLAINFKNLEHDFFIIDSFFINKLELLMLVSLLILIGTAYIIFSHCRFLAPFT